MIAEGIIVYDRPTVFLYTRTGRKRIADGIHDFGLVGRRAFFRIWGNTFLSEDIVTSELTKVPDFTGYLVGAVFGHFVRQRDHKIEISPDGITWTLSLDKEVDNCTIYGDVVTYLGDNECGYTRDGITWVHLNEDGFSSVHGQYVYVDNEDVDGFTVYKDGVRIGALDIPYVICVAWRDVVVDFVDDRAYLIKDLAYTIRNLPMEVVSARSDGTMLAINDGTRWLITMDLVNFRSIPQQNVRLIAGRLVAFSKTGYDVLHSPYALERITGRLEHSRNVLASFRRFSVPFALFLSVEEFFW